MELPYLARELAAAHKRTKSAILRGDYLEQACRLLLRVTQPITAPLATLRDEYGQQYYRYSEAVRRRAAAARGAATQLMGQAGALPVGDSGDGPYTVEVAFDAADLAEQAMREDGSTAVLPESLDPPPCMGSYGARWNVHCAECGELVISFTTEAVDGDADRLAACTRMGRQTREQHLRVCRAR